MNVTTERTRLQTIIDTAARTQRRWTVIATVLCFAALIVVVAAFIVGVGDRALAVRVLAPTIAALFVGMFVFYFVFERVVRTLQDAAAQAGFDLAALDKPEAHTARLPGITGIVGRLLGAQQGR